EAALVQALEDLEAHAHPGLGTRFAPGFERLLGLSNQDIGLGLGVTNIEIEAIGGALAAHRTAGTRLIKREIFAAQSLERVSAVFSRGFAIHAGDRKSTRLNSSHVKSSYAVFCLKK